MSTNFETFPLFPCVISATVLREDVSWINDIIKQLDFHSIAHYDSNLSFASNDVNFLNQHPDAKRIILETFNNFKNTELRLDTTNFDITTSWATKTLTNGHSHSHSHRNSYYSGVLYLDDYADGGHLLFENYGVRPDTFMVNEPSEWNLYNIESFEVRPEKNLIVFFPSYLRHRVTTYTGIKDRYSLAFNFLPRGTIGYGDSCVSL
jgi:uncharacterized protein (TIGR02466 family)